MPEEHSRGGGGGVVAKVALLWRGGSRGVRDMASPSLENLGARFSETSFPHFMAPFRQIGRCLILRQEFKTFVPTINYTLSVYLSVCLSRHL